MRSIYPGPAEEIDLLRAYGAEEVGAGTARTEHYGPARLDDNLKEARQARGQEELPTLALVTRSCHLDWQSPLFTTAVYRPVVVTVTDAPPENRERAAEVADVLLAGDRLVDMERAVASLGERGARRVLCEGGPTLNGHLAAAGRLDELCLTLSPCLVGGTEARVITGPALPWPFDVTVTHVFEEDRFFFLRLACLHPEVRH